MSGRHCLKCLHCRVCAGYHALSDVTPGSDPVMYCTKRHWDLDPMDPGYTREAIFAAFAKAETCPDYEEETT